MMKNVTIYTDGACSGNPGDGGWAAILMYKTAVKEICGSAENTTNNRMEITAAMMALQALKQRCRVDIYTDSAYLCDTFCKHWIDNWSRNGWSKADKKPVENRDLWERMLELTSMHEVHWNKVKGHADNEYNNRCDKLARDQIQKMRKAADPEKEPSK